MAPIEAKTVKGADGETWGYQGLTAEEQREILLQDLLESDEDFSGMPEVVDSDSEDEEEVLCQPCGDGERKRGCR